MYNRHIATYYFVNCMIFIGSTWLLLQVFNNHEVLAAALSARLDQDRIEEIIDFRRKMGWIGLCVIPLTLLIKYALIYLPFYAGTLIEDLSLRPKDIMKGIVQLDFIFAAPLLMRYVYFTYIHPEYAPEEVQIYPLSLASFAGEHLPPYLLYPMQGMNAFEFVFVIMLIVYFKKFFNKGVEASMFVCKYYVLPQLIWYSLLSLISLL